LEHTDHVRLRNIQRYVHHHFEGWLVSLTRHGVRHERYFSDGPGRADRSLAKAMKWRDVVERRLPPPVKIKRQMSTNTSGIVGVSRTVERTRRGAVLERWSAVWPTMDGRKKQSFSVGRYGERGARSRAIAARRAGVAAYIDARRRAIVRRRRRSA
jgi:hypothetical protein